MDADTRLLRSIVGKLRFGKLDVILDGMSTVSCGTTCRGLNLSGGRSEGDFFASRDMDNDRVA